MGLYLLLSAILSVPACSTSPTENRKPVHPVRGKVTFQGKPAKGAFILFIPVNEPVEAVDPRPRAEAGDDGTFTLSIYGDNDGAPAGEYIVAMNWPGGVLPDGREEPQDKLLGRYSDPAKSKLRATVKEGPNELPTFELK
jgi:hypothetical protein